MRMVGASPEAASEGDSGKAALLPLVLRLFQDYSDTLLATEALPRPHSTARLAATIVDSIERNVSILELLASSFGRNGAEISEV